MKKAYSFFLLFVFLFPLSIYSQTIESVIKELPPHFSVLTTWGLRPEWDEKSENIYFLDKMVGNVFKINIKTRQITSVTSGFYHGGIFRVLCLSNGDLLLGVAGKIFDSENPTAGRHKLEMYILKKGENNKPVSLGEFFDEGPAVSKNSLKIAWTLPGQREICMADIQYSGGVPRLVNKKTIISYKDSSTYVRLETQNFRPPNDNELIYTHYWGDSKDSFHHSETYGFNLETGKTVDYTHLPDSYNEAEGIFPDGKFTMIESDRHQTKERRNQYKLDIYKLKLDGSGEVERFADFSTRYPGILRSDNPVVDRDGRFAAVQFGFMDGSGNGQGIFLFDIEQYEKSKLIHPKEYHVSFKGNDSNTGSASSPFKTISAASRVAFPGDTITVHAGTYREWVNPLRGGESDSKRIIYRAAPGEKAEIKGSEIITGWKKEKDGIWKVIIPNSFFNGYNPYQDSVFGDWFIRKGRIHHTGDVFLNGKSLYEKESLIKVINSVADTKIKDPEGSTYTWYCESDANNTTIWANFQKFNPNKELIEISARRTCFYPDKPGVNYITITGFEISQAATQWGAPTAEQVGMISTNWNKGWIIENNVIHDSKCSGITLGKEKGTGHNVWSLDEGNVNRDGNIHYIEVTFRTIRNGWNKEHIGSHIVRNNTIFNCEQTGICGSMGAAFSTIENNHIYNIWTKRQFEGWEIGGIKFHAAVDTYIRKNRINDCGRGIWLDWMTQGTRVSSNLMYNNDLQDIFLEVNHGPFIVDNNILLSPKSVTTQSEGGAYINNLITGTFYTWPEPNRFTPYFLPHSTDIAGLTTIIGGDDRLYNNIFIEKGEPPASDEITLYGSAIYNTAKLPCWISGNVYYSGSKHSLSEKLFFELSSLNPEVTLREEGESVYLKLNLDAGFSGNKVQIITSEILGSAKIPKARFENADGTPIILNRDFFGKIRSGDKTTAGPFADTGEGIVTLKVW